MARRGQTEEIHIHIRGHAPQTQPMLANELEEWVHHLLNQSFQHARVLGGGLPGHTQVRLTLKLEPIEYVTDFSNHPMGEQLKAIAASRTRGISLGRLQMKKPGWVLEYLASQISTDEVYSIDQQLSRHLLTDKD